MPSLEHSGLGRKSPVGVPRLDRGTQLVNTPSRWCLTAYPDAGEAVLYEAPSDADRTCGEVRLAVPVPDDIAQARAADNRDRVNRRVRAKFRRYAVANRCDRVVTLTYRAGDPCAECGAERPRRSCRRCRDRVRSDVRGFARRMRLAHGSVPYEYAVEAHKDGSAHVHVVMPKGYAIAERVTRALARLWGHGYVDADPPKRLRKDLSARELCRLAAAYASKYAVKAIEGSDWDAFEHTYELAQGFQPVAVRARCYDMASAYERAVVEMGGAAPRYEWFSGTDPDWLGPPVAFMGW